MTREGWDNEDLRRYHCIDDMRDFTKTLQRLRSIAWMTALRSEMLLLKCAKSLVHLFDYILCVFVPESNL